MTPVEKLISDLKKFCANEGSYNRQERGAVQLILGEFESAPKPWTPPWPLKIPDWPNVWFAVDSEGSGAWFDIEPYFDLNLGSVWFCTHPSLTCVEAGYFEIPLGVDWRTMKIQVKKDGVLLR